MQQTSYKQAFGAGQFTKPEDLVNSATIALERKPRPIINEILELDDALEHLLKQHFDLSDKLRGAYPAEGQQLANKTMDEIAVEPSTGCELKDRLASLKQKAFYIGRLNNELIGKLWL